MSRSKKPIMLLTPSRRERVAEILSSYDGLGGVNAKAAVISRQLGEPCTFREAMSLLAQLQKKEPKPSKSAEDTNQMRFEAMAAQRGDIYH